MGLLPCGWIMDDVESLTLWVNLYFVLHLWLKNRGLEELLKLLKPLKRVKRA